MDYLIMFLFMISLPMLVISLSYSIFTLFDFILYCKTGKCFRHNTL